MLAITLYNVVVAVHVMAIVVAFGVVFTYPVVLPWLRRTHPEAMAGVHAAQVQIGRRLIGPGMVVALAAGIYLASDADVWDQTWVTVPLVILVAIGGLAGAVYTPTERKLSTLAGGGALGAEYDALLRRYLAFAAAGAGLVLVAIFFMVAKPGA